MFKATLEDTEADIAEIKKLLQEKSEQMMKEALKGIAESEEDLREIEKAIKNQGWIKEEPENPDN